MTKTEYLQLIKEGEDDFYSIDTVNRNLDKIDSMFGKLAWFCVCGSRKMDVNKIVDAEGFQLFSGVRAIVYFTWGNTAENITMNINGTGAYPVKYKNEPLPAGFIQAEWALEVVYHAGCWRVVGDLADKRAQELAERIDGMTPSDIGALPASGNAVSASKWNTARKINGMSIDGTADRTNYGVCSTSGSTAAKTVSCAGFNLATGAEITVKFNNTNTASNPTLNVNGMGAKAIYYKGVPVPSGYIVANGMYTFRYNGTQWEFVGDLCQKQVELLKEDSKKLDVDVRSLQEKSDSMDELFDLMFEGLSDKLQGTDLSPVNGMIWVYAPEGSSKMHYHSGSVDMDETVQCAEIIVEPERVYKVVTYIGGDYISSVIPIQETDISYRLCVPTKELKEGKIVTVFKTSEMTKRILINRIGSKEDIVVYRLKL